MSASAYSLKSMALGALVFLGAGAVGVILTPASPPPASPPRRPSGPDNAALEDEIQRLRAEIRQRKLVLEAPISLSASDGGEAEASPARARPQSAVSQLRERLAELEGALARRAAADPEAAIDEALEAFAQAMAAKDGGAARAALAKLASIETEGAWREALRVWNELEDNKWLGLGGRKRRGWGSRGFFHWLLRGARQLEPARAERFQRQAIEYLAAMEPDRDRLAETLTQTLRRLPPPAKLSPEQLRQRQRRRGRVPDLYRDAFEFLAESRAPGAGTFLEDSLADTRLPSDLRVEAVRGLSRLNTPASQGAILTALDDLDPEVAKAAALAAAIGRVSSPGLYLTRVEAKGEGAKLGLARGVVLIAANGEPLRSNRDVRRLRRYRGKEVKLQIERDGVRSVLVWRVKGELGVRGQAVTPTRAQSD